MVTMFLPTTCYSAFFILYSVAPAHSQDVIRNLWQENSKTKALTNYEYQVKKLQVNRDDEIIDIKVYYECMCPYCRKFMSNDLKKVINELSSNINLETYPYGNAKTHMNGYNITFECQHGPQECYGNKLHACTLHHLSGGAKYSGELYNICMMEFSQQGKGSDDTAADVCASLMSVRDDAIKQCAKGEDGTNLLKYYGDESKAVGFHQVPHVSINGKVYTGNNFFNDLCSIYQNPPLACKQ